MDEKVITFYT